MNPYENNNYSDLKRQYQSSRDQFINSDAENKKVFKKFNEMFNKYLEKEKNEKHCQNTGDKTAE